MADRKKKATAFVPRMMVTSVVLGVIPACVVAACSAGSTTTTQVGGQDAAQDSNGNGDGPNQIPLAQQGFDSGIDNNDSGFIALAQQGFDAGSDASNDG